MQIGKSSVRLEQEPVIYSAASIAGQKESEGPLGQLFDKIETDPTSGQDNWESAESQLQKEAASMAILKAGLKSGDIRYLFAGDLLGQLIATSFGLMELQIPLFGLYGACSTMGEAISLAAMTVDAGNADKTLALASSHFGSAEKQFRFPLGYGNQRPYSATWTVTGCGAVVVGKFEDGGKGNNSPLAKVTGFTTGKIVDIGCTDSMNMGAAMAPAAFDTLLRHLEDFQARPEDYDKIITGDLGSIGQEILLKLMRDKGIPIDGRHMDCGIEIFDSQTQDTHAGGSGCGCSAVTLCSYILPKLKDKTWKKVLFMPTGALLSQVSFNEGDNIPGIAHGVVLEAI